jgi:nucleotide-binding universal stress UspA family protein
MSTLRSIVAAVPHGTVVVGVDGSPGAERALRWAAREAQDHHRPLTLVSAILLPEKYRMGDAVMYYEEICQDARAEGHRVLEAARRTAEELAPGVDVREVPAEADPRDVLIELTKGAATVVVGSRGQGSVRSLLLGSTSVALTRHAHCPVVVCRPVTAEVEPRARIVVGVEGSRRSVATAEYAAALASYRHLPLHVVHSRWLGPLGDTIPDQGIRLAETLAGLQEKYPDVTITRENIDAAPEDRLVALSHDATAVVVGAHAGGVPSEILTGSVATSVVEHARCPVVVVPHREE